MGDFGRPVEYVPENVAKTQAYMDECEANNDLPSIAGLAIYLNCSRKTVYNWSEQNPDFLHILEKLLAKQEVKLINGGLKGTYNPTISKLILTKHGYADKVESDLTTKGKEINSVPITSWGQSDGDSTES